MLNNPNECVNALRKVVEGLYEVFDLAAERPYDPDDNDKPLFGVSSQFDRPNEFLQTLLDMLRVFFEPDPPGTFFLNANPCFLYDAMPDKPVQLGYASVLGDPGESFSAMLDEKIFPRLAALGYQQETFSNGFFAICRGPDRGGRIKFGDELLCEAAMALQANISVDEAWGGLYSAIEGKPRGFPKQNCAGISFDESLGDRLRVSVWLIIPVHQA
ncbi:MAG: hypothetical protein P9F75_18085 [Candidatus Contendobacter sp.]|nr:hypothetical protein [Candidatus Contendobacter sp.]